MPLSAPWFRLGNMDTERRPQPTPEPITVSFLAADGPVSGTVAIAGIESAGFHGWLELMDELERLRGLGGGQHLGKLLARADA